MALRRKVNRLREERTSRGLSGYDLELLTLIPAQQIYLIERGIRRPKFHEKQLLAEALGVDLEALFPKHLMRNKEIEGFPSEVSSASCE